LFSENLLRITPKTTNKIPLGQAPRGQFLIHIRVKESRIKPMKRMKEHYLTFPKKGHKDCNKHTFFFQTK